MGARIIAIADRFERILHDEMQDIDSALAKVKSMLATQFDATIYAPLEKMARKLFRSIDRDTDSIVKTKDLAPGMVIYRDVITGTGLLLLRKGTVLSDKNIETLKRAVNLDLYKSGILVNKKKRGA
jgi:hypothetical protein